MAHIIRLGVQSSKQVLLLVLIAIFALFPYGFHGLTLTNLSFQKNQAFAAGSLTYGVVPNYDIEGTTFNQTYNNPVTISNARTVHFNETGTVMIISANNASRQYSLATGFDVGTASDTGTNYTHTTGNLGGAVFGNGGRVMVTSNGGGSNLRIHSLTSPYQLSTASVVANHDLGAEVDGMFFDPSGMRFYTSRTSAGDLAQYDLSVAWDVTTASHVATISINSQDDFPNDLFIDETGRKLIVSGEENFDLYQYELTTPWDLSTAVFQDQVGITSSTRGTTFNSDGSKIYLVRLTDGDVQERDLVGLDNGFVESKDNNGVIDNTHERQQRISIKLTGDTFNDTGNDNILNYPGQYTLPNLPSGLTPELRLFQGDTVAELLITGTTTDHTVLDTVLDLQFEFNDSAFTGGNASMISGATGPASSGFPVQFFGGSAPGGVLQDLVFWVNAGYGVYEDGNEDGGSTDVAEDGDGVAAWHDISGPQNHLDETTTNDEPVWSENAINFNPAVVFDGGDDVRWDDGDSLWFEGQSEFEIFNLVKPDAIDHFGWIDTQSGDSSEHLFANMGTANDYNFGVTGTANPANSLVSATDIRTTDPTLLSFSFDGSQSGVNSVYDAYFQGTEYDVEGGNTSGGTISTGHDFFILGNNDSGSGAARDWEGLIPEVAQYNRVLTDEEREKVNSYFGIKYGMTFSATTSSSTAMDYVASDGTAVWTNDADGYDQDVTVIGRDDIALLNQKISRSYNPTTGVTLALSGDFTTANTSSSRAETHTNDIQFIAIAHDGNATSTLQTTDLDGNLYFQRIAREWKVDKTANFTDTVSMKFDGFDDTYYLISSADGDFSTGTTELGQLNSDGEITGISLNDGDYITLALPVLPGPGGISAGMNIWFKANQNGDSTVDIEGVTTDGTDITNWYSQTSFAGFGNATIPGRSPATYTDGSSTLFNFNASALHDGVGDAYFIPSMPSGDENYNMYFVFAPTLTNSVSTLASNGNFSGGANLQHQFSVANTGNVFAATQAQDQLTAVGAVTSNENLFMNFFYDTNIDTKTIYKNGLAIETTSAQSNQGTINTNANLGYRQGPNSEYFSGYIAEVVFYEDELSDSDRQRIDSYFGLKYGLTLDQTTPTDYLASNGTTTMWVAADNAGYTNNIFGIGRDDYQSLDQRVSRSFDQSGDIVTVALQDDFTNDNEAPSRTTTHTNDMQFFMIANDAGATSTQTTELDTSTYTERVTREWRVDKENFSQQVYMQFDGLDDNWDLLVDSDGDFSSGAISAGTLSATGTIGPVSFVDGNFFTLARSGNQIEFSTLAASSTDESTTDNVPTLFVNGVIAATATIEVQATASSTATEGAGNDYTFATQTVTIPAGTYDGTASTSIPFSGFTVLDDIDVEGDEIVVFTLANSSDPTLLVGDANGDSEVASTTTYTITDDDTGILIEFATSTYVSIDEATNVTLEFIVSGGDITGGSDQTVEIQTTAQTATTTDYTFANPTILTIPAADYTTPATTTSTFVINDDSLIEGSETVSLQLASTTALLGVGTTSAAVVTITDDDGYQLSITKNQDGSENDAGTTTPVVFEVSVTPTNISGVAITGDVTYSGTASSTNDYVAGPTTFSIADGTATTTISLAVVEDSLLEGVETLIAALSNLSDGMISTGTSTANISDDDTGDFTLSTTTLTINENATGTFTVVLDQQPTSDVVLSVSSNATAEASVVPITLTFSTSTWNVAQIVTVTGVDDTTVPDDTATVTIAVVDASSDDGFDPAVDQTVSVTIIDDDDTDNDGNLDTTEDAGFNGGDGNGDGIPDSIQQSVSGAPNPVTGAYTTLEVSGGCTFITQNAFVAESSLAVADSSADYPVGLVDFQVSCTTPGDSANVVLYYDQDYDTSDWTYKKYDSSGNVYSDLTSAVTFGTFTHAVGPETGNTVTTASFIVTDGDPATDEDKTVDGVINDPSGPAVTVTTTTSSGGGGTRYVCRDKEATNYKMFGKHDQRRCIYEEDLLEQQIKELQEAIDAFKNEANATGELRQLLGGGEPNVPAEFQGQVCQRYMRDYIFPNRDNDPAEVKKLQVFLNEAYGENLTVDGIYNTDDIEAVKRYQQTHYRQILWPWDIETPTANVYKTTVTKLNLEMCGYDMDTPYFTEYMGVGDVSLEAVRIQDFINLTNAPTSGYPTNGLPLTTTYTQATANAVKAYQNRYRTTVLDPWGLQSGTGWWYQTTRSSANALVGTPEDEITLDNGVSHTAF